MAKALAEAGEDIAEVFNIHAMMLDDDDFVDAIKEIINGQRRCADLRFAASAFRHDERRLSLRELALDRFRNRKLRRVKAVARVFADMVVDA